MILQLGIHSDKLYVRRKDDNLQKLTIYNLNNLEEKPNEITLPLVASSLIRDYQTPLCFGKTHVIGSYKEGETYKLISASYEDLNKYSGTGDTNSLWQIESFPTYPIFFAQGNNFVAVTQDVNTNSFSLTEIHFEDGRCFMLSLADNISIFSPEEPFKKCDTLSYSDGRLVLAFNEKSVNKISVYDVEKKYTTIVFEEKGSRIMDFFPFPSRMLRSTAFKTHYFQLTTKSDENYPIINGERRSSFYASIITLNFGNKVHRTRISERLKKIGVVFDNEKK